MLHMMVKAEEIEISNIEGLQAIAADAYYNNNTYSGTVIKLTADLDLANVSWTPLAHLKPHSMALSMAGGIPFPTSTC